MNKCLITLLIMAFASCAKMTQKNPKEMLSNYDEQFNYSDKNGQYFVKISSGMEKNNKTFFTKRMMGISGGQNNKPLEQSVVISTVGSLKKKLMILRPSVSQYNVWFDGKKYTSELKINTAKKAIDVKMISPESQWSGSKQIKFPSSKILPCFFSQVIDCAKVSGFISKATDKKSGSMSLLVVWEGYPYLNETLSDFPSELFSKAQLEYDGMTKENERRFNLRVAGQSIFYILDDKDALKKVFSVSQGITMVNQSSKDSDSEAEDGGDFA